jgi:uncharacterized protein
MTRIQISRVSFTFLLSNISFPKCKETALRKNFLQWNKSDGFGHLINEPLFKEENNMSAIQRIALVLTIIGAINWGLIGFFQFDLVAAIFGGQDSALSRIIYGLVGIAGLINLGLLFKPTEEIEREPHTEPTR